MSETATTLKASDLRIGNLMQDSLTGAYLKVSDLNDEEKIVSRVIDRSKFPLPDGWSMEPIPLTPELLEEAGFEKDKNENYHKGNDKSYCIAKSDINNQWNWYIAADVRLMVAANFNGIEFLHQLQNLYFALTGQELEINL